MTNEREKRRESLYLRDYMTDDTDNSGRQPVPSRELTKDEVALELMRFISVTTGVGKGSSGAGFGGKSAKSPEEQVEALLQLFERCRSVVQKSS